MLHGKNIFLHLDQVIYKMKTIKENKNFKTAIQLEHYQNIMNSISYETINSKRHSVISIFLLLYLKFSSNSFIEFKQ